MSHFWATLWSALSSHESEQIKRERQRMHETTIITARKIEDLDKEVSKATKNVEDLKPRKAHGRSA